MKNPSIDINSLNLSDEDINALNLGFPVKITNSSIDTSKISTIIVVDKNDKNTYCLPIETPYCYTDINYNFEENVWFQEELSISKPTQQTPIEDYKDENGLYSTPTGVRGDVNYDGLVNNIDVMVLRKYILHLIEW